MHSNKQLSPKKMLIASPWNSFAFFKSSPKIVVGYVPVADVVEIVFSTDGDELLDSGLHDVKTFC